MKTIPEASVGRQGPCFKTVPNREDQSHSPGVPTTGPAKDEQTHQHSSPCINVTSLIKKKMAMPPQSHTQHGNMLTTALKVPFSTVGKKTRRKYTQCSPGIGLQGVLSLPSPLFPHVLRETGGQTSEVYTVQLHPQMVQGKSTLGPAEWRPPSLEPELPHPHPHSMTLVPSSRKPLLPSHTELACPHPNQSHFTINFHSTIVPLSG